MSQGGPTASFMEECVYQHMVDSNIDLLSLNPEKHLTSADNAFIQSIKAGLASNTDNIIDHGYTRPIDASHMEEIVKSVAVSIISKRAVYL